MAFFSKSNTRLAEQDLAYFSYCHMMFGFKFIFNVIRTNDVVNLHVILILAWRGWLGAGPILIGRNDDHGRLFALAMGGS